MKKFFNCVIIIVLLILTIFMATPNYEYPVPVTNSYTTLSVPTYIGYEEGLWFISDCYHNQVIYSRDINLPLNEWFVLTDDISRGHTLACDGKNYLIDDTENNRVLVFKRKHDSFINTGIFENIGIRPHYIYFHKKTNAFYCWSSQSGEMYVFKTGILSGNVYIDRVIKINELNGVYVRTFTIIGDRIYFVSGNENSKIIECDLNSFEIIKEYPVIPDIAGMVQISYLDDWFYITISTDNMGNQDAATIIRCKKLEDLSDPNGYEDIYSYFMEGGTPYSIFEANGSLYLLEHRLPEVSIWRFSIKNGIPVDVKTVH